MLGLVDVVVGRTLVIVPVIAEEQKTKAVAHVGAGSSDDEAAVVAQTWKATVGSFRMVAGSALCEVSLDGRTDDRCAVERTYLHGLGCIDFVAGDE
jgi:hypothetical protein